MTPEPHNPGPVPLAIPMNDGTTLAALRFPAPTAPAPAIVVLTPYRKELWANGLAANGLDGIDHEVVIADVRGIGGSGGDWDGPLSPREISDGVELLAWVAAQDFCDGRTALYGGSYQGLNTLLIAARRPPSLSCVVSIVSPVDVYRDMWHRGGIPSHTFWGNHVGYSNQHRPDAQLRILREFYLETSADPFDGDRFRSRSVEYVLDRIEAPVLLIGGWHDYFLRGTLRAFAKMRAPRRLFVGNWGHGVPDVDRLRSEQDRWFGHWFHGTGEDPATGANVVVQAVGSGAWQELAVWPAPGEIPFARWRITDTPARVRVLCHSAENPPAAPPGPDWPWDVVWGETWTTDTSTTESRTLYRGPVELRLVLSSDAATDIEAYARLSIARADGTLVGVTEGRLRASHRALDLARSGRTAEGDVVMPWHPHDRADPLPLGEPVTLEIEIFPVNVELAPGECLRLGLTFVRADETVAPADVVVLPESRVLLPSVPPAAR